MKQFKHNHDHPLDGRSWFVVDYHRNVQLTKEQDRPAKLQETADYFIAGLTDATIAAQNMVVAAESLGIGTVFLGSLHNDAQQIIDLLGLPEYTFPAVGLAVGWPNQEPQLKPRLPKEVMHMENQYQALENPLKDIEAYDEEITGYYDTRDLNNRVDRFSKQVADKMETLPPKRLALLEVIQQQGFLKEQNWVKKRGLKWILKILQNMNKNKLMRD